uniref:Uncharacterized protein n=1 Tax=Panagrolaimus sp. JU765 TaxID=591449 RepID=A0AC34Q4R2_9BILA
MRTYADEEDRDYLTNRPDNLGELKMKPVDPETGYDSQGMTDRPADVVDKLEFESGEFEFSGVNEIIFVFVGISTDI